MNYLHHNNFILDLNFRRKFNLDSLVDSGFYLNKYPSKTLCKDHNNNSNISLAYSKALIIKSWDSNVDFFLGLKILRSFNLINRNRLENIFKRYLKDEFVWGEVEKMLNCNFISISNDLIYDSKDILSYSLLSSFLLNLYVNEFDDFMQDTVVKYNLRKEFYNFNNNFKGSISPFLNVFKRFSPIKVEMNFQQLVDLKSLVYAKYECVS